MKDAHSPTPQTHRVATEIGVRSSEFGEIFSYFGYYILKSVEFLAPPLIATLTLLVFSAAGMKKAISFSIRLSLARLFYTIPYYYIIFIYNYAYDSIESIFLSTLASAFVILLTFAGALFCVRVAIFVREKSAKQSKGEVISELPEILKKRSGLDFISDASLPIFVFVILRFAYSFITEIVDTAAFFIEYGADYTAEEILTILGNYVLLFALLVVSYILCVKVKNTLTKDTEKELSEIQN